jgi:hypothetical protein
VHHVGTLFSIQRTRTVAKSAFSYNLMLGVRSSTFVERLLEMANGSGAPRPISERIAMGLVGVFLIGLPLVLFVLIAPRFFGSWRGALAPLAVAGALIMFETVMARAPASHTARLTRRIQTRLLVSTVLGALLGLLWGAVAGDVPLLTAMVWGVWFGLFFRGLDEVWRARQRRHAATSECGPSNAQPKI